MFYINKYNTKLSLLINLVINMNSDYKFRLTIAIMKPTANIFLFKTHRMEGIVIKHIKLDIAFNDRPIIPLKMGF